MSSFSKSVEKRLRALRGSSTQSASYHGTNLEYLGLKTAQIRALAKAVDSELQFSWRDAVADLWKLKIYEGRVLAISIAARHKKEFLKSDWRRFAEWIAESEGWAMIDAISCEILAPLLVLHPPLASKIKPWSKHNNLWIRRASLAVFTRPVRDGLFLDSAFLHAKRLVSDPDPMIYKALSWLLRSSIKQDRQIVVKYLNTHENKLHSSVLREVRTKLRTGKKNG